MSAQDRNYEQEFDRLLALYRDSCAASEPPPDFMPRLWSRIDAAQSWTRQAWKWANGLVAAAALASLLFVLLQVSTRPSVDFYSATYLETLLAQTETEVTPVEVAGLGAPEPPAQEPAQR